MTVEKLISLLQSVNPLARVAIYLPSEDFFFGIVDMDQPNSEVVHLHAGDLEDEIVG